MFSKKKNCYKIFEKTRQRNSIKHVRAFAFNKNKKKIKTHFSRLRPSAGKFSYLGSYSSKIFFNRNKLWSMYAPFFPDLKKNKFSQVFNFGARAGLNSDKIGFWRYSGASLIWRELRFAPASSVFYKPLRNSWKKTQKNYWAKTFFPFYKLSSYSKTLSISNFLFNKFLPAGVKLNLKKTNSPSNYFSQQKNSFLDLKPTADSSKYSGFSLLKTLKLTAPRPLTLFNIYENSSTKIQYSKTNTPAQFNRFFDLNPELSFNNECNFLDEFVYKKKAIRGLVVPDRKNTRNNFVKSSAKYYYYYYRNDPLAGSYFLDKIISVFSSRYEKKNVRKVFYKLFFDINSEFTIDMLYSMIESLKPTYINVKVRRGREHYEAPILASDSKATIKAVKFFKKAVLARKYDSSFYDKLRGEIYDFFCWDGYKNNYYEDYILTSKQNMHLRHFRSAVKY